MQNLIQNLITILTLLCLFTACSKKSKPIVLIEGEPQEISEIRGYFHEMEKDEDGIPLSIKDDFDHLDKSATEAEYLIIKDNVKKMMALLHVKTVKDYDLVHLNHEKENACKKLAFFNRRDGSWMKLMKEKQDLKDNNDYWRLYKLELFLDGKFYFKTNRSSSALSNDWEKHCNE